MSMSLKGISFSLSFLTNFWIQMFECKVFVFRLLKFWKCFWRLKLFLKNLRGDNLPLLSVFSYIMNIRKKLDILYSNTNLALECIILWIQWLKAAIIWECKRWFKRKSSRTTQLQQRIPITTHRNNRMRLWLDGSSWQAGSTLYGGRGGWKADTQPRYRWSRRA